MKWKVGQSKRVRGTVMSFTWNKRGKTKSVYPGSWSWNPDSKHKKPACQLLDHDVQFRSNRTEPGIRYSRKEIK